jgi:class 3 adenylate cyclase/tetratricopeptide (TPR) repeat protein
LADASPALPAAQRRQLTILFCDLVGSTRLATELDPEDMQDLLRGFLDACRDQIEATGGFVAKYMGDGVLAYFGFPDAHEDDAARALHAALNIVAAVGRLRTPHGSALAVRSGIATGLAVVGAPLGTGAAAELAVIGDTPNLAARLQTLALANQIVISDRTRELVTGVFEVERLPRTTLKGFDTNRPAWRVIGTSAAPSRFGQRRDRGLTPMVDRTEEVAMIIAAWRQAAAERGGVVGVFGPAGVGKSRLVYEAHRVIARTPHVAVTGAGVPIFANSPFHAIAQMLRRRLRVLGGATADGLEAMLRRAGIARDPALPLLAEMLGIALPETAAPLAMRADARRSALIEALVALVDTGAAGWPTLLVIEDLQWLDPSSLSLLARLAEGAVARRLLILFTARDRSPGLELATTLRIDLAGLGADDMRALLGAVAVPLHRSTIDSVIGRSAGIPLFAEELAALVATQDNDALVAAQDGRAPVTTREGSAGALVPATLSDLLMARLGGLGAALPLVQTAAVLGTECQRDLLARVAHLEAAAIDTVIARLIAAELIEPHPAKFVFRHSLVRDAAYEALLRRDRRSLHARAAAVIAAEFAGLLAEQPDVVAHHLTEAGSADAVEAWLGAGRAMAARSAYLEAERAFNRGLGLLDRVPVASRNAVELRLQSELAVVAQINHGYSAEVTVAAATRARNLAEIDGDIARQLDNTAWQWGAASSAGDYATAGRLAGQVMRLARAQALPEGLATAHMIALTSRYRVGHLLAAEEAFEHGREHFELPAFVARPGAIEQTFGNAAIVAWLLGDHDEARRRLDPVLRLAATVEQPYRQAMAAFMAALALTIFGAFDEARRAALLATEISDAHGFPQYTLGARIILGRAEAGLGRAEAGAALLRGGIAAMAGTRLGAAITLYLTWLAAVEQMIGDTAAATMTIDRALTANPLERFYRSESLRVRAALALAAGDHAAATAAAAEAVATARAMGARSLHALAVAGHNDILRAVGGGLSPSS